MANSTIGIGANGQPAVNGGGVGAGVMPVNTVDPQGYAAANAAVDNKSATPTLQDQIDNASYGTTPKPVQALTKDQLSTAPFQGITKDNYSSMIGTRATELQNAGLYTHDIQQQLDQLGKGLSQPSTQDQITEGVQTQNDYLKSLQDANARAQANAQNNVVAPLASQIATSPEGPSSSGNADILNKANTYAGKVAGQDPEVQRMNALVKGQQQTLESLQASLENTKYADLGTALGKQSQALADLFTKQQTDKDLQAQKAQSAYSSMMTTAPGALSSDPNAVANMTAAGVPPQIANAMINIDKQMATFDKTDPTYQLKQAQAKAQLDALQYSGMTPAQIGTATAFKQVISAFESGDPNATGLADAMGLTNNPIVQQYEAQTAKVNSDAIVNAGITGAFDPPNSKLKGSYTVIPGTNGKPGQIQFSLGGQAVPRNVPASTIWSNAGSDIDQCGGFGNAFVGIPGLMGDTLAQKRAVVTTGSGASTVPVVGGLAALDVGTPEGHVRVVTGVEKDAQGNITGYDYSQTNADPKNNPGAYSQGHTDLPPGKTWGNLGIMGFFDPAKYLSATTAPKELPPDFQSQVDTVAKEDSGTALSSVKTWALGVNGAATNGKLNSYGNSLVSQVISKANEDRLAPGFQTNAQTKTAQAQGFQVSEADRKKAVNAGSAPEAKTTLTADAQDVLNGRNTLFNIRQTMGRSTQAANYMSNLRDQIRQSDPTFDFVASDAGAKFMSSSTYQKSTIAINTVLPNIDKVIELSNDVGRLGVKGIDDALQNTGMQFNNKPVANFHEVQKLIADELGTALGAGNMSDMKLQLGFDITDPSVSKEVFASNMGEVKDFLQNKQQAMDNIRYKSPTSSTGNSSSNRTTNTPATTPKVVPIPKGLTKSSPSGDVAAFLRNGLGRDPTQTEIQNAYKQLP